jgi:TolB-like protein/Flp pilus assembly protein TadD
VIVVAVALFAYRMMSGSSPDDPSATTSVAQIRTLAVLPLKNASESPEEEYFADGMTDALISDLSRVSALRVIPASSSMNYKDTDKSLSEIEDELGADAFIEGSVWHGENRVRINAALIVANSNERLWGESYESEVSDVLALQAKIARAITVQIKVNIAPLEQQRFNQARSVNPDAHRAYIKGLYYRQLSTYEGLEKAAEEYEKAITLDPEFAAPYVGLADVFAWVGPAKRAEELALKALELDPTMAAAHTLLAGIKLDRWDWDGARAELEKAKALQPNLPEAHVVEGKLLLLVGKYDEGLSEYRSALALNPLSHPIACSLVGKYNYVRQFDKAVSYGIDVADNFPYCPFEHLDIGQAYIHKGMYEEGIHHIEESLATANTWGGKAALACAYAHSGRTDEANEILSELIARGAGPYNIATVHAALGERDRALDALESAYERRSSSMMWLNHEPLFDALRDDPRFVKLVEQIGQP